MQVVKVISVEQRSSVHAPEHSMKFVLSFIVLSCENLAAIATTMNKNLSIVKALIRLIATVPVLFAVVSCSQLTYVHCDPHSWHGQGVRDGLRGISPRAANEYERTCTHPSTVFDRQVYLAGLEEGNAEYCAGQNGFHLGLSGVKSENVCANEDSEAFKDGLKTGRKLRNAILDLDSSNYVRKLVRGGFTVLPGSFYLSHAEGEDNRRHESRLYGQNPEVLITRGQPRSSDKQTPLRVRTANLVAKCEKAKHNAEEKGFHTSINCS